MAVTPLSWSAGAWSDLRGYTVAPACEAIRLALAERANAVGESIPSILSSAVPTGGLPTASWASAVDDLVDALIPQYLDTSGARPYEAWSEAAILTAIGAGARVLHGGAGYMFRAAWAQQVRAIVNQLLAHPLTATTGTFETRTSGDGHGTWAAAVSAFAAASWATEYTYEGAGHTGTDGASYRVDRWRAVISLTVPSGVAYDLYVYTFGVDVGGSNYEDNDYGTPAPGWNWLLSSVGTGAQQDHAIGDFDTVTVSEPSSETIGWLALSSGLGVTEAPIAILSPTFAYA